MSVGFHKKPELFGGGQRYALGKPTQRSPCSRRLRILPRSAGHRCGSERLRLLAQGNPTQAGKQNSTQSRSFWALSALVFTRNEPLTRATRAVVLILIIVQRGPAWAHPATGGGVVALEVTAHAPPVVLLPRCHFTQPSATQRPRSRGAVRAPTVSRGSQSATASARGRSRAMSAVARRCARCPPSAARPRPLP